MSFPAAICLFAAVLRRSLSCGRSTAVTYVRGLYRRTVRIYGKHWFRSRRPHAEPVLTTIVIARASFNTILLIRRLPYYVHVLFGWRPPMEEKKATPNRKVGVRPFNASTRWCVLL